MGGQRPQPSGLSHAQSQDSTSLFGTRYVCTVPAREPPKKWSLPYKYTSIHTHSFRTITKNKQTTTTTLHSSTSLLLVGYDHICNLLFKWRHCWTWKGLAIIMQETGTVLGESRQKITLGMALPTHFKWLKCQCRWVLLKITGLFNRCIFFFSFNQSGNTSLLSPHYEHSIPLDPEATVVTLVPAQGSHQPVNLWHKWCDF